MNHAPVLSTEKITKRFGSVAALNEVSFDLRPGEVHALCGENGAGKSTLMKVLSGQHPFGSYDGVVHVGGNIARFRDVRDSESNGIAIVHQELSLIDSLTVAENIVLGKFPRRGWRIDWPATNAIAVQTLSRSPVQISPEAMVSNLGVGQQQLIEIARALAKNPRILILDEPSAALTSAEILVLLEEVRNLRTRNVACIYISHKLDEVKKIADRITVLRDGSSVTTRTADSLPIAEIIKHMVGREIKDIYPAREESKQGDRLLEVRDLHAESPFDHHVALKGVSLSVHAGEVLGIGGLMGAGRSELLMHIYGLWGCTTRGQVFVDGTPYSHRLPCDSIHRGMMLVTENRKRFGLVPRQSVHRNLSLSSLQAVAPRGRIDSVAERTRNGAMLKKLHFRALSSESEARQLSGGNQQKVVLGRGLLTDPRIVLLDEPTRGVDVGARREIYEEIKRLANEGKAVVVVSSDLSELIGVSDRIVMMNEGTTTRSFNAAEFNQDQLMAAALGK